MHRCIQVDSSFPAIKALGPLFKLTDIFIRDDGYSSENRQVTLPKHIRFKYDDDEDDDDSGGKNSSIVSIESAEDIILADNEGVMEEMSALGLPLSFQTNKQNKGGQSKGKSKCAQHKQQHSQKTHNEQVEESCKSNEEKQYCADFHVKSNNSSSSSLPDQSEFSGCGSNGSNMLDYLLEDDMSLTEQLNAQGLILDNSIMEPEISCSAVIEQPAKDSQNRVVLDQEYNDIGRCCGTCGDWSAYWDCFYLRYYFYNAQTKESTWYPPPGMESFASGESCCSIDESNVGLSGTDAGPSTDQSEEAQSIKSELVDKAEECCTINDHHVMDTSAGTKQKTKRKSRRRKKSINNSEADEFYQAEESFIDITKYWCQRYLLFSRFDDGIKMDEEGWFSVTPEAIAWHQASRCVGETVIDCFTGVGGNAIQFAKTSKHVIAIDIDPNKIDYAHHNAAIYGVQDNIDFMTGDSISLASNLKADSVFLSPPWGGPDYVKVKSYSIHMLQPYDGQFLFNTFKAIAPMIIMFLPRNVDIEQLAELSLSADPPWSLEVEKNFLNGKFKAVTAYFSRTTV